jgi:hypothetical protein
MVEVNLMTPVPHTCEWRQALIRNGETFIVVMACSFCHSVDLRPATARDLRTLPVIADEHSTSTLAA